MIRFPFAVNHQVVTINLNKIRLYAKQMTRRMEMPNATISVDDWLCGYNETITVLKLCGFSQKGTR